MKKQILKTIFSLLTLLSIFSCSNSDSGQNLSQVPLAKSIYDNSNFGIYKGVFVGSSGTIVLDISNTNASITATLIIDGVTHTFTTNQTIQQNQFTTINFIEGNNSFTIIIAFLPLNLITPMAPIPGGVANATIVSFHVLKFSRIAQR